jgi:ubiquinone biosynthesis protein
MLDSYLRQILLDGHFQADPHPGNFLVAEDGALVLLDFGCTKTLEQRTRVGFGRVLSAFVTGDDRAVAEELFALGFRTRSGSPDTLEVFARLMLGRFREALLTGSFTWPTTDQLKAEATNAVRALGDDPVVELPPDFVMIGRVFGLLGGLFQHYKPELDWSRILLPWISVAASV